MEIDGRKITDYSAALIRKAKDFETVEIPRGVKALPDRMFEYCGKIKHLYLPNTLKKLGKNNFTNAGGTFTPNEGLLSIHFEEGTNLNEWHEITFLKYCPYDPPKVNDKEMPKNYREITVTVDADVKDEAWLCYNSNPYNMVTTPKTERVKPGTSATFKIGKINPYICYKPNATKRLSDKCPLTVHIKKGFLGPKVIEE